MGDLLILLLLILLFAGWWYQRGMKDAALRGAALRCHVLGLQLLDETVQLASLWPTRNSVGDWVLRRGYRFEFTSTGRERYEGKVIMRGRLLEALQLPPYASPLDENGEILKTNPPTLH